MTEITPERLAQIESDAPAIIHNAMRFDRLNDTSVWTGGNSLAEEAARRTVHFLGIPDLIAALEAAQAELAVWKSVFPDIAPENVLPDRAKLEAENANLRDRLSEAENQLEQYEAIIDPNVEWKDLP